MVETNPASVSSVAPDGKTILTLIDRRAATVAANVVHSNNRINPRAVLMVAAGVGVLGAIFYMFLFYSVQGVGVSPTVRTATATASAVRSVTPASFGGLPALILPTNTALPPSPVPRPTNTPAPTQTPTITPNVILSVRTFWPKGGSWGSAQTQSGIDPAALNGLGGACPAVWPLGTYLQFQSGYKFLCADRANLVCNGAICPVIMYTNDKSVLVGVIQARVILPVGLYAAATQGR